VVEEVCKVNKKGVSLSERNGLEERVEAGTHRFRRPTNPARKCPRGLADA